MSYADEKVRMSVSTGEGKPQRQEDFRVDHIKKATVSLLRTLVSMTSTLQPLPDERTISIALFYNESAPTDYQPPHFRQATTHEEKLSFESTPVKIKLGTVTTNHHEVSVKVKTVVDSFAEASVENSR